MMQENICVHKTGRGERKKERVSETQRVRGEREEEEGENGERQRH